MAALWCGCALSLPTWRAWRRREKSRRSNLVFESVPHWKNNHQTQRTDLGLFARWSQVQFCSWGAACRACQHRTAPTSELRHGLAWDRFVVNIDSISWTFAHSSLDTLMSTSAKLNHLSLCRMSMNFLVLRGVWPRHNYLLAAWHPTQHCTWVQHIGVIAKNSLTHLCVLEFVQTRSRFARLTPWQLLLSAFCRPPRLRLTTPGCLFWSACPAGGISSRPPAATLHLWKGGFPAPCRSLAWTPGLPERAQHPDCFKSATNPQMCASHFPNRFAGNPHTLFRRGSSRFFSLENHSLSATAPRGPTFWQCWTTRRGTMISRAWPLTFSPICHNLSHGLT